MVEYVEKIELDRIRPGPNPRQERIESGKATADLEGSMKTVGEQRVPIFVTKRSDGLFEVIDGHRRFHVAKKYGWDRIKAIVLPTDSELDVLKEMGIINMNMQELEPLEKGAILNAYFESLMVKEGLNPKSPEDRKRARGKLLDYLSQTVFRFTPSTLSGWLRIYENFTRKDLQDVNSYEAAMALQAARRLKVEPSVVVREAKSAGLNSKGYWQLPKVAEDTNDVKEAVGKAKELQDGSTSSYITYPKSIQRRVRFLARTLKVDTQAMLVDLIEIGSVAALAKLFEIKNPTRSKIYEVWDGYIKKDIRQRMRGFDVPVTGPTIIEKPEFYSTLRQHFLEDQRQKQEALK